MTVSKKKSTAAADATPVKSANATRRWWLVIACIVVLSGAVAAVYARSIQGPFLWDDEASVVTNRSITKLWPPLGTDEAPGPLRPSPNTPISARPLVNLSFAVNYYFSGVAPAGYRAVNVLIHILAALLLWALVERTLRLDFFEGRFTKSAGPISFVAALLWALHPLNTESVVYVTQRTEAMVGLFYLAALYAALRYETSAETGTRRRWLFAAVAAGLCGALTKEMIASLPAVALLYERTFVTGSFVRALRRSWPLYLGFAATWVVIAAIYAVGAHTPNAGFEGRISPYVWWFTQAEVLLIYLKLTFCPWPLSVHYEIPYLETLSAAWPYLAAFAVFTFASLVLVWRRTSAGFVAGTVVAVLSPTLLVPLVGEIVAERRMYLPLAAIVPLVVAGTYWVASSLVARKKQAPHAQSSSRGTLLFVATAAVAVSVVFGLLDLRRLDAYADPLTLFTDTIAQQPNDLTILINLGVEQARTGELDAALATFARAEQLYADSPLLNYKLNPEVYRLQFNIGLTYQQLGKPYEAIAYYDAAIRLRPDFAEAHYNLGLLLQTLGQFDDAIVQYRDAINLQPNFADAHANLGALLGLREAGLSEAIPHLQKSARLKPDALGYIALADAYLRAGRPDESIEAAKTAEKLAREAGDTVLAGEISAWLSPSRTRAAQPAPRP